MLRLLIVARGGLAVLLLLQLGAHLLHHLLLPGHGRAPLLQLTRHLRLLPGQLLHLGQELVGEVIGGGGAGLRGLRRRGRRLFVVGQLDAGGGEL